MTMKKRLIDEKLLEILVCPVTQDTLVYNAETNELMSRKAKLAFPIHEGIPVMLVDQARKID